MATYNVMSVPFKSRGPLPEGNFGDTTYAPGSGVSARLSDAGAQLAGHAAQANARALDALRSGIGKVGQFALDYADMLEREDMTKSQEAFRKYQLEGHEMRRQLEQLRGKDALDGDQHRNVEARMVDWSRRAREVYGKDLGKRGSYYFNSHADAFASQQVSWAMHHRMRQSDVYRKQELSAAIDAEGENIALDPYNPEVVARSLGRLRGLLEQSGEVNGWSPEMVDAAFASVRTAAFKKAVSGQIMAGNIDGAQRLLQQHGGEMELQDALALRQAIGQGAMDLMRAQIGAGDIDGAEQTLASVSRGGGGSQAVSFTKNRNPAVLGNNPSGLGYTGKKGEYNKYSSLEDAFAAYIKQYRVYNTRDGLKTWGDIARKWMSGSAVRGGKAEGYVRDIGRYKRRR